MLAAFLGRELEEHVRHREHAHEVEARRARPAHVGIGIGPAPVGALLEQGERRDAAPAKDRPVAADDVETTGTDAAADGGCLSPRLG